MLCRLVVSLQMQNRKTTDKISIVPNPPNYSIVAIADQRALCLHFATDNQLAKPCTACVWVNQGKWALMADPSKCDTQFRLQSHRLLTKPPFHTILEASPQLQTPVTFCSFIAVCDSGMRH